VNIDNIKVKTLLFLLHFITLINLLYTSMYHI